jgi:NTE family protein
MLVQGLSKKLLCLAAVLILVASCQQAVSTGRPSVPVPPPVKKEPKIALVLGGGSAKGFAHVGVIRVLEQEKIPIHMVVGTSVGSLIGGIYAARPDSFQLEWTAFKIDRNDILDFSIASKMGPVQGERLEEFVEQNVKARKVEDTKIPFIPVATDLNTGETVTLDKGPIGKAIRASSSIPGIFVPVSFGNRTLVDGGVTDNVACDIAKAKGADIIIAVNLQKDVKSDQIDSLVDVIAQSVSIMMRESSKAKMACADVIIEPEAKGVGMFDFTKKKQLVEEGIKAAKLAMPKIREAIARFGR